LANNKDILTHDFGRAITFSAAKWLSEKKLICKNCGKALYQLYISTDNPQEFKIQRCLTKNEYVVKKIIELLKISIIKKLK
jgi:hypothetical protein